MKQQSSSFRRIYGAAVLLAAITIAGLLSALFGDGIWNQLSWVALSIPLIVILWKYLAPRNRRPV